MVYEKKTGFVDLEKLENDSELTTVSGGTAKRTAYKCIIHTHTYANLCIPVPHGMEPDYPEIPLR